MERKRSKTSCITVKSAKPDYISCLPDHVIDQILSHLPIKEAVRTSILSSKWSNNWKTLPNLVFDKDCVSTTPSQDSLVTNNKFLRIVDHVLLLHYGSIDKFEISDHNCKLVGLNPEVDIHRWILHLIRSSVKELVLYFFIKQRYEIPWCLFSCQSLRHLELHFCRLKPPTTFEGFRNLKSLHLNNVTLTQDAFENLISNSPLLEKLIMNNLDGFKQINIHAPNLKVFDFGGEFEDINFDNTFKLSELTVYLTYWRIQGECSSNLLRFFVHLPQIQTLEIHHYLLKYLAAGVVPVNLPTPLINLKSLSLRINFHDWKEISAALCLLKSSPNLQKLEIIFPLGLTGLLTSSHCWENIYSEPTMPIQVQHVRLNGIFGFKHELDFVRFLLLYSPLLEKIIVVPGENAKPELMAELTRLHEEVSRQAEVRFYDEENYEEHSS